LVQNSSTRFMDSPLVSTEEDILLNLLMLVFNNGWRFIYILIFIQTRQDNLMNLKVLKQ